MYSEYLDIFVMKRDANYFYKNVDPPRGMDTSLASAVVKSLETGSLTPLIKEELKLKIQTSRLAAGKEELPAVVFKEPQKFPLSAEEERRRDIRRERNRVAALKCRKKKKFTLQSAEKELLEQRSRGRRLRTIIEKMTQEKEEMLRKFKERAIPLPQNINVSDSSQEIKEESAAGQETYLYTPTSPGEACPITHIPTNYQQEPAEQPSLFYTSTTPPPYFEIPREFNPDNSFSWHPSSTLSLPTDSPSPAEIPTTIFDLNSKECVFDLKQEGLLANNDVEAQVPGYLMADDDVISSQELLTLYD